MRAGWRQELLFLILCILSVCVSYGMRVDFSRLREIRKPYILEKRGDKVSTNPCPVEKPFLCKSPKQTCIALGNICDHTPDCPDGFDENPQMCSARNRPSTQEMEDFLYRNENWIIPKLFNGADPEMVAHSLVVAQSLEDLSLMVGAGDKEKNLRDAFRAVREGDERPLLKMGMPEDEWFDVQYMLNRILEGGLQV